MSLVQLESKFKNNSLTLHKLLFFIQPTMNLFEVLAETVTSICQLEIRGANVLSLLFHKISSLTGNESAHTLISHITKKAAVPYIEILQHWIMKGVILDPHQEFMVVDNDLYHRDLINVNHYSAEYWEKRYTLRPDRIPVFFDDHTDFILRAGKYLNVIRQCGNQVLPLQTADLHFTPNSLTYLYESIMKAYTFASQTLLQVLIKDNDLMGHLLSVKRYLLLQQGDFINQFMDAADQELSKNVDKVLPMKLENLLGLTLRLSSTKHDAYKDDLHCQLFPLALLDQMSKIHLAGTEDQNWTNDKTDLSALECFAFRYDVQWPLSLILNHFAILEYQMLFRQLFYCKHVERQLCKYVKLS